MTKYEDLSIVYKEHMERSKETQMILDRELEEKNKELEKFKTLCKERLDKFSSAHMSFEQANNKAQRLEYEIAEKNEELIDLKRKVEQVRSKRNYLLMFKDEKLFIEFKKTKDNEGTALVEVEHLRAEVQRLIKLLKSTKEVRVFLDGFNNKS